MPTQMESLEDRFGSSLDLVESGDQQEWEDHTQREEGEEEDHEHDGNLQNEDDDEDYRNISRYEYITSGAMNHSESAEIISKKYLERDQVKQALEEEERRKRLMKTRYRKTQVQKWQDKTSRSPFKVNLVADNERLDEENRLRMMQEAKRSKELEKRTRQAKNDVILKALSESSDLELLRREKRAIIDEEKRLKALMDLEKTNSHRKLDLIAARNAEKKRKEDKEIFRRKQRQQEIEIREQKYRQLLKEKLAIEDK